MQISKDKVVTFHYRLSNEQGSELETSHGEDPVAYLHGHGNIISGLEKGLEGQSAEDVLTVTVEPQDGYGLRKEE